MKSTLTSISIIVTTILLLSLGACSQEEKKRDQPEISIEETQLQLIEKIEDGTHEFPVTIQHPSGIDEVIVHITLENQLISNFEVEDINVHRESRRYNRNYNQFAQNLFIGKPIEEITKYENIAGASLTTKDIQKYFQER